MFPQVCVLFITLTFLIIQICCGFPVAHSDRGSKRFAIRGCDRNLSVRHAPDGFPFQLLGSQWLLPGGNTWRPSRVFFPSAETSCMRFHGNRLLTVSTRGLHSREIRIHLWSRCDLGYEWYSCMRYRWFEQRRLWRWVFVLKGNKNKKNGIYYIVSIGYNHNYKYSELLSRETPFEQELLFHSSFAWKVSYKPSLLTLLNGTSKLKFIAFDIAPQ